MSKRTTPKKSKPMNAFYAQSGGVSAVINASAAGVIEAAINKFDIGLEFTFRNLLFEVTPPENPEETEAAPFDQRSLLIYLQARF